MGSQNSVARFDVPLFLGSGKHLASLQGRFIGRISRWHQAAL
jgi:hypothetical protein